MALKDTDLLAVYRATGENAGNYSTTVADILARVPTAAAPPLTAVLQENNISQNIAIEIDNSSDEPVILLTPDVNSDSYFVNHVRFDEGLKIGSATEAKFKISEVDDLKGAISIGKPKPINKGPITFALLIDLIIL